MKLTRLPRVPAFDQDVPSREPEPAGVMYRTIQKDLKETERVARNEPPYPS